MSMTESEVIERILYMGVGRSGLENENSCIAKALRELKQYRAIGTVSEFRELKEKATPKKIGHCVFYREMGYGTPWKCLTCGADQTKEEFSCEDGSEPEEKHTFCWMCGQKLDWSEGKE